MYHLSCLQSASDPCVPSRTEGFHLNPSRTEGFVQIQFKTLFMTVPVMARVQSESRPVTHHKSIPPCHSRIWMNLAAILAQVFISEPAGSYALMWNLWFLYACIVHVYTGTILCMYIQAQYRHISICTEMHILFICLYVYVWFIYVSIHLYMSVCAYVIPICIYVYICTYVYVYACIVCICIYLCLLLYAPVYVCMCLHMYVFAYISMYMYILLQYIHIHAHTSVYMHISLDAFYSMRRAGYVCV